MVAIACSMDPNCTTFRYNPETKLGFLCRDFDAKHTSFIPEYKEDEWTLCEFDTGKGISYKTKNIRWNPYWLNNYN